MGKVEWGVCSEFPLLLKEWGDEVVVYHTGSANTHLLSSFAAAVLRELQKQPQTVDKLVDSLSSVGFLDSSCDFTEIENCLHQLERLFLVEQSQ